MIRALHLTWNPLIGDVPPKERALLLKELEDFAAAIKREGTASVLVESLFNPIPTWLHWEDLTERQCERLADCLSAYASDIGKGAMIGLPCVTFEIEEEQ